MLGFAAVLIITAAMGGVAYWSGAKISAVSNTLANEVSPAACSASQISEGVLRSMFEFRGYMLYNDQKYADKTVSHLADADKALTDLSNLANSKNMQALQKDATEMRGVFDTYRKLVDEKIQLEQKFLAEAAKIRQIGPRMTEAVAAFAAAQHEALVKQLNDSAADKAAVADLLRKNQAASRIAVSLAIIRASATNFLSSKLATHSQAACEELAKVQDVIKGVESTGAESTSAGLAQAKACIGEYQASLGMLASIDEQVQANDKVRTPAYTRLLNLASAQLNGANENVRTSSVETAKNATSSMRMMIGGVLAAIVLGSVLAFIITRSLSRALRRIVDQLSSGSQQTSAAAGQVSAASQSLAQGASEQAAAIEETTSSVEEMASMTKQNAGNAGEAKTLAASTKSSADKGHEAMSRMTAAIGDIKKSSDATAKIVKTIDEIAFQTNLLALNAAVEAARAGEAGKGFAVVAEEVRNLAQRSAEAAKNTASMIEESVKNADNGVAISQEVAKALEEIGGQARKVNDLVGEIAAASNEQAQGIEPDQQRRGPDGPGHADQRGQRRGIRLGRRRAVRPGRRAQQDGPGTDGHGGRFKRNHCRAEPCDPCRPRPCRHVRRTGVAQESSLSGPGKTCSRAEDARRSGQPRAPERPVKR